jgi:biopolymer transport protein ExbD
MKNFVAKYLGSLGVIGISGVVFMCGTVLAESNSIATTTAKTTTITERVTERKNTLKLQISAEQNAKLAKNCVESQKLIKSISAQDQNNANKRQQVYTNISSRLATVVAGLNKQGLDTTALKNIQSQFNAAANQYLVDDATYKTTIEDLSAMDCVADPTGFEATLTEARQLRKKLASEVGQVASVKTALTAELSKSISALNASKVQGAKQ